MTRFFKGLGGSCGCDDPVYHPDGECGHPAIVQRVVASIFVVSLCLECYRDCHIIKELQHPIEPA